MITLAAYVIMACLSDDPSAQCFALEEEYPSLFSCEAAKRELVEFWQLHMGDMPPMPVHCEDQDLHT